MILVFGGTTEGRKAVEVLEEAGSPFFYSTKTGEQDITLHHGVAISGALDSDEMAAFCSEHGIQLIIDAAHPFATQLHKTVAAVADAAAIPAIRYERVFPPRDAGITWIDDYSQVPTDIHSLLATTGVQSISKLKHLEKKGIKVYYRILRRPSSIALAKAQGAGDGQLCYYENGDTIDVKAEAILLKESGESGGFCQKVAAARSRNMRVIALRRPAMPASFHCVNGPHGLRRMVERLLPEFFPLHSGLTTGTCATAAAVAAAIRLTRGETPDEVPVLLPDGETISVAVGYGDDYAFCIKEAGDDPDVTDGVEVRVSLAIDHSPIDELQTPGVADAGGAVVTNVQCPTFRSALPLGSSKNVQFIGGDGVGRFTLPGFDFPPGEPAINRGPREMIRLNLMEVARSAPCLQNATIKVTISVPGGEAIARRTFNPRLGIEGGISIIGVSGIVKSFSEEAFIDSIRKCMTVAKAAFAEEHSDNRKSENSNCHVVINSGAKSERFLRERYPDLPAQAFVQYGNYIGETLRIASDLQISTVTLGVMLGKAVKLAQGHLDTHSKKATMDLGFIHSLLDEAGLDIDISGITLARELWERIPPARLHDFARTVIRRCREQCLPLLPDGELTILLIDDNGTIYEI